MCGYIIVLHSIDSIGFPGDIPHYCGIMGNFTVSGIFHEYCMRCTSLAMSVGRFPSINLFIMWVYVWFISLNNAALQPWLSHHTWKWSIQTHWSQIQRRLRQRVDLDHYHNPCISHCWAYALGTRPLAGLYGVGYMEVACISFIHHWSLELTFINFWDNS